MPLLAPNINSYKRLLENYWAPVHLSWGFEGRLSSIRVVAPPIYTQSATRLEIHIPGADLDPHYSLAATLAAGWRGVEKETVISIPPSSAKSNPCEPELLPNTLEEALKRFGAASR